MERVQDHFACAQKPYTRGFLRSMEAEGYFAQAALRNPRGAEITVRYYTQGQPLEQISEFFHVVGERIRQIKYKFLEDLLASSDPYFQRMYSLDLMPMGNDSPHSRFQKARFRGDPTAMVADAILNGASRNDILESGVSSIGLSRMYQVIGNSWGIEIDHVKEKKRDLQKILEDISREDDTARLRNLFSEVDNSVYDAMRESGSNLLTMLRNAIKAGGYHIRGKEFQLFINTIDNDSLRPDQVVPVGVFTKDVKSGSQKGIQTYYFTRSDFVQRAIALWNQNPDLDKYLTNPVRLVAGPVPEKLPTTNDFAKGTYPRLYQLMAKLGYRILPGFSLQDTTLPLRNCPAPVFTWIKRTGSRHSGGLIYDPQFEEVLGNWLIQVLPLLNHRSLQAINPTYSTPPGQ